MKIYMDLESCPTWMGACESCFGWHLNRLMAGDFQQSACMLEWDDQCQEEITYHLHDKDGQDKVLIVNQENWAAAYNSWSQLLASQQTNA
jgi:hypothetical protein